MKSIKILFFTIFLFSAGVINAQVKNYTAQWKKVDELIQKKNLPASALTEVRKIYALAKKEKQEAQVIKALVYMADLQSVNRENNTILSIRETEAELKTATGASAALLNSMLAGMYWQYLSNNRWKFYNRTNTTNFDKSDIATWTLDDLHQKISAYFLASLKNEQLLKATRLDNYEAIIVKGNSRHLRPTLYDLLAHRALEYFKNTEADLKKPAYAFEITQPQAFAPATEFVSFRFTTKDSLSLHHKALLIYQDLLRFHLKDVKQDALIDADIDRISFVYSNSTAPNKDSLYIAALQSLAGRYPANPLVKQAQYLIAQWHETKATTYDPLKDTTYRYHRKIARDILATIVKDSLVKNEGWVNSYNLLKSLEAKSFQFELEKVNLPSAPFRSLVQYRNISALHFRIIRATDQLKKTLEANDEQDAFWTKLAAAPVTRSWQQQLPQTDDLQTHAVEIKIDSLPVGSYYLLASADPKFDKNKNPLGARLFHVSAISYVNRQQDFFVLDRQSGQPLAGAKATIYKQVYDYKTSKYAKVVQGNYTADRNGHFKMAATKERDYYGYFVDLQHGADRLIQDEPTHEYYYYDRNNEPQKTVRNIFFFTDRSLYRPGQTMYFKGIVLRSSQDNNDILPGYTTTIHLVNANYQYIDSVVVTTNEFGSFNGSFVLPANTLNGQFHLADKNNTVHASTFMVEEYKRPKFYVEFDTIRNTYKAGDIITVNASAKAYAGNHIDGAKVSYRVVRQPRFIYTWFFSRSWLPRVQPMEIAHGETTTDKNGQFQFSFEAIPDKSIDARFDPVFDYRIYVDVTDINGETRSSEKHVTVGYKSLLLNVTAPARITTDSLNQIKVRAENMNGEFQASIVTINFYKLSPEQRLIRSRYWQQPDQFIYTKEEYLKYFPLDEYKNETDPASWDKTLALNITGLTSPDGTVPFGNSNLDAGHYAMEVITKDRDGLEVKDVRYFELFRKNADHFNKPDYLWAAGSNRAIEPGEKASIQVGSAATNVFLVQQTVKPSPKPGDLPNNDKIRQPDEEEKDNSSFSFSSLQNNKKTFDFAATEADRGGYAVAFFFVKDNRFHQFADRIDVPWTNKELQVEYASFREKTLPGSEEKWTVKIKGIQNEKIAAEVLASMYDASLDQFYPHSWSKPQIWPVYYSQITWNATTNFTDVLSMQRWVEDERTRQFIKTYDQLALSPHSVAERRYYQLSKNAVMRSESAREVAAPPIANQQADMAGNVVADTTAVAEEGAIGADAERKQDVDNAIQIRKRFNETAFFFPDLKTDTEGNITFSFTTPDALTRWKLQTFAHTKGLAFGLASKEIITQKDLMVQPNMPRFLRQGDQLELSAKIVNMTEKELTGQAELQLVDAATGKSVDGWFMNTFPNQYFTVAAGSSELVKFPIQVPVQFSSALTWRVIARSGNVSDGEENLMPVLSNKLLVTETMPLPVRGNTTRDFSFDKLLQSGNSPTLQHHALTVEYSSNPAWYAVQALPYLMDYPYDCAEQTWNRYYANALASRIANASPKLKEIFNRWKTIDTAALISNLQKNQELKSALLEETPWVLQAKSETEQKKNIALLFDMVRMSAEMEGNLAKLKEMQSPNGGFVWFKGGPDDRFVTQYILTGIGHLRKLGVDIKDLQPIVTKGLAYLDQKIKEDHDLLVKSKADLKKQQPGHTQVQYLYMRSFFPELPLAKAAVKAHTYYLGQAAQLWMKQNQLLQGMTALAVYRNASTSQVPRAILASLKETSILHEELGRYWKEIGFGKSWYWWQAPIETQSLMVEVFSEIAKDTTTVDELRTWLIKNKQTNNWRTTKATADACYALLLQGTNWLSHEPVVEIKLGTTVINNTSQQAEAGTGYFKQQIEGSKITASMGKISVKVQPSPTQQNNPVAAPSWGAVYWQYFEDMDKITMAATPLRLNKKLFIEKNTDRGPVLQPVTDGAALQVGNKIKVRIELRVDRDMEYVHMKDMRASALEPVNVLSGYRWQGGLGYYESTKDASTNFFFNYLRKGTYVFEYDLFVTHTGNFSNGITTIQSMYAPEFTAHSEGVRISVE